MTKQPRDQRKTHPARDRRAARNRPLAMTSPSFSHYHNTFAKILVRASTAIFAVTLYPLAAAAASPARERIDNMSIYEKMKMASEASGKGEEMIATLSGIGLIFGVLIFSFIFLRRWKIPRMGYFLVTLIILLTRFREPSIIFWKVGAFTAGLFSLTMFVLAHKKLDFDSRKEPLYFLFNAFTLLVIAFSTEVFTICLAGFSLLASLFFVVTLKPIPRGKFLKHDADDKILETLVKKASRKL